MSPHRVEAPTDDGAVLAVPTLDEAAAVAAHNRQRLDDWHYDFQGRSAHRLRAMTRSAVIAAAAEYVRRGRLTAMSDPEIRDQRSEISDLLPLPPSAEGEGRGEGAWPAASPSQTPHADPLPAAGRGRSLVAPHYFFLTGHQPELFHPGVWIKNFAACELARRCGGTAIHLVVDNDTVKKTTVRVPTGTLGEPSVVHLPLDRWQGEIPFEEYRVTDDELFRQFGARVAAAVRPMGFEPLAADFWSFAVADGSADAGLGEQIARARRRQETAWGCENLELPVGRLCQTEPFYWFACHVLAQLPRFASIYNESLVDYRSRYRIRSRNHPVPELHSDGEWHEAPFWVWTAERPRRRHLFVRHVGLELELSDRDQWTARLPLSADREACCAVDALDDIARRGVKIRTRALTTTLFTRLCLADLFIHGLGGARYDELADAIIERFFGLRPPGFMTLTGTLHLPVAARLTGADRAAELRRLLRDLQYNPDRYLSRHIAGVSDVDRLVSEKRRLFDQHPTKRAERRSQFDHFREINAALVPFLAGQREATESALVAAEAAAAATTILKSRDWAFCVYPEESLKRFMRAVGHRPM